MQVRIKWVENACFVAESGSGHAIVLDGSPEIGGRNLGARPMELLLMSLGSCSAMDVISILEKSRQDVTDCVIEVSGERAETIPKVYTKIHVHYIVTGRQLKDPQVKRAVDLSAEKYCSVSAMLKLATELTYDYEVKEETPATT
ncbi:putative redox protein, regulator of disulfide bond formation [Beggiatoa alba B18LD]|uniref:Putative redox protein, regulator of disulfide bond formation n=1 Tax=Beggiatoa alba B18LD TaxID=395493 RepID=I3CC13_9GAMM|nr:OsmC family protein [Beggiatoa alba]EIJ41156.1 putative redox protein, regulator of disulfide bond formation [Beggiatoa alba B18LD]